MTFDWEKECRSAKDVLGFCLRNLDSCAFSSRPRYGKKWQKHAAEWATIYLATKDIADNETKKKFYQDEAYRAESLEVEPCRFGDVDAQRNTPNDSGRPQLGSFVAGRMFEFNDVRQGVLVWVGRERAVIIGYSGTPYVLDATKLTVVDDKSIKYDADGIMSFVKTLREEIRYSFGDDE